MGEGIAWLDGKLVHLTAVQVWWICERRRTDLLRKRPRLKGCQSFDLDQPHARGLPKPARFIQQMTEDNMRILREWHSWAGSPEL